MPAVWVNSMRLLYYKTVGGIKMQLSIPDNSFLDSFEHLGTFPLDVYKKNEINLFMLRINANEFDYALLVNNLLEPVITYSVSRKVQKDYSNKPHKKKEISMDEISLGFKLLSSIYAQGMSNKQVNELEQDESIKWEYDIDELLQQLNTVCSILLSDTFFKFYQSWKKPITKLMGNAIALEFLTIMWLDWKDRGCPNTLSGEVKALQRDARILFDKLVFEYATKTWRGSGDSKMSSDIKNWKQRITPVNAEDWHKFIIGACAGNYNGQDTTVKTLKPVLYYYYVIMSCAPINQVNVSFDVDHIIPKERFVGNTMIAKTYRDSLINLALLPTKDNISKKAKALNEITDNWLKLQITTYTGIKENEFDQYSDISNITSIYKKRSNLFSTAFSTNRMTALSK